MPRRGSYNYFRYYDPKTGRYITSDPIGLAGGLNSCLYANAKPLRFVDPTGENAAAIPVIIGGGIIILSSPTAQNAVQNTVHSIIDTVTNVIDSITPKQCGKYYFEQERYYGGPGKNVHL